MEWIRRDKIKVKPDTLYAILANIGRGWFCAVATYNSESQLWTEDTDYWEWPDIHIHWCFELPPAPEIVTNDKQEE